MRTREGALLWIGGRGMANEPDLGFLQEAVGSRADIEVVPEDELNEYLKTPGANRVLGAVVSPSVHAPIVAARNMFRRLPGRELIFLGEGGDERARKRAINLGFLYGHHRTIDRSNPDEVVQVVQGLLNQAASRRHYRSALSRINQQLAKPRVETARRRLAISDRLLASILAQSPDSLFALDLDGYLLTFNRAADDFFFLDGAEGKHVDKTPLARRLPGLKQLAKTAIIEGKTARQEMYVESGNGRTMDVEASATPVIDDDGDQVGVTVLLRNVSRLKAAQRELRDLNRSLEERVEKRTVELNELNKQMEGFLYSVAHDLRAPVRTIGGFAEILISDFGDSFPEEARDLLRRISEAAGRMDVLIRDLLTYSRVTTVNLTLEPVDLDEAMEAARAGVADQATGMGGEIQIERPLGTVRAHRITLEQATINLLSNALRYAKPNVAPRIRVYTERDSKRVRLWVEDNGIGIAPEYHERIFGIFERLDEVSNASGTGIGLAIVKRGIERLGGRVGVESETGKGSRFWIELAAVAGGKT